MLKRILTGIGLIAVVTAFFFLREVNPAYFEILIWLFAVIGSYEVARAMGDRIIPLQKWSAIILAALFAPLFYLLYNWGDSEVCCFIGVAALTVFAVMWQLAVGVFSSKRVTLESMGLSLLAVFYPALLLVFMSTVNLSPFLSTLGLLLIFIISPFADTFAFFIGSIFKGPKLCPAVSPNKTISGAIGGVLGGIIGSLALYFIFSYAVAEIIPPWWYFILMGAIGSVLTEFGDLVESVIKRKAGIKDMGKLLPGHGGIMDRIDGMLFAAPFICLCIMFYV